MESIFTMGLPASGRSLAPLQAWRGVAVYSFLALLLLSGPGYVLAQQKQEATRRDPTVPPAAWLATQPDGDAPAPPTAGAPQVQVIVVGKTRRFALVDGKVIQRGDVLDDTKVVAIKADKVVMDDASKSLRTTPDVEKKKPVVSKSRKKSVMIPEASVSSKAQ